MNNQKVCISKQATFISVILVMLIAYVFIAYRTMLNKTSTNSRASVTEQVPISMPPIPSDEQLNSALFYTATLYGSGNIQLKGERPIITGTPKMAIFMKRQDGSYEFIDLFTATREDLDNRFSNFGFPPQTPVTREDIELSNQFVLYELK